MTVSCFTVNKYSKSDFLRQQQQHEIEKNQLQKQMSNWKNSAESLSKEKDSLTKRQNMDLFAYKQECEALMSQAKKREKMYQKKIKQLQEVCSCVLFNIIYIIYTQVRF